jgi:hypothetical protein
MKRERKVLTSEGVGREREEARTDRPRGLQRRLLRKGMVVVILGLLCLRVDLAEALYCGKRLVLVGASRAEVLDKCGEPEVRDHWVEYRSVLQPLSFSPLQEEMYFPVRIEEWVYNFGAQRFRQQFRFEDGRLHDIEARGYGD